MTCAFHPIFLVLSFGVTKPWSPLLSFTATPPKPTPPSARMASLATWSIIKAVMGLRVSEEEEYEGVDIAECGMEAYPEFVSSK